MVGCSFVGEKLKVGEKVELVLGLAAGGWEAEKLNCGGGGDLN